MTTPSAIPKSATINQMSKPRLTSVGPMLSGEPRTLLLGEEEGVGLFVDGAGDGERGKALVVGGGGW